MVTNWACHGIIGAKGTIIKPIDRFQFHSRLNIARIRRPVADRIVKGLLPLWVGCLLQRQDQHLGYLGTGDRSVRLEAAFIDTVDYPVGLQVPDRFVGMIRAGHVIEDRLLLTVVDRLWVNTGLQRTDRRQGHILVLLPEQIEVDPAPAEWSHC
jgi:hypothetical protein